MLGKEIFDINQKFASDRSCAFSSNLEQPPQLQNASPSQLQANTPGRNSSLSYIVAQHQRAGVVQIESLVAGYLSLLPTDMQSESHQMLSRAVAQKHFKAARMRLVRVEESAKLIRIAEEDRRKVSRTNDHHIWYFGPERKAGSRMRIRQIKERKARDVIRAAA